MILKSICQLLAFFVCLRASEGFLGPASITTSPRNVTKLEGDRAEFICEAKAVPNTVTHIWFHNGVEINQLSILKTRTVVRSDGTLVISPTLAEDSGKFTCEVTNGIGSPDSASAYLSVECSASITTSPRNVTILEGDRAEFICKSKDLPTTVTHKWFHNGVEINQLSRLKTRTVVRNDGTLFISPTLAEDSGKLTCEVTNGIGSPDSASAFLSVDFPASITTPPRNVTKFEGDRAEFICGVKAVPTTVTYKWFYNGVEIYQLSRWKTRTVVRSDGTLVISPTLVDDSGKFTCEATNGIGTPYSASAFLSVLFPASITTPPGNVTKLEFDKAEFICEAKAVPNTVTHKWFYNGVEIYQLLRLKTRTVVRKDGTLVISPTLAEDSGKFTCEVTNGIGSPDSASAFLSVEYPARITFSPTIQYLPLGLSGVIRCHVQASPQFQFIVWSKDGSQFDPNAHRGVVALNDGSLLFQRVSHEIQGKYRCTPYNIHGTAGTSNIMEVLVKYKK